MHSPFLVSIKCPECGAPIRHPEGSLTFSCGFCASVLRVAEQGRDLKYVIPPRFPREQVSALIKRPLMEKRGDFGRLLRLKSTIYFFKPFWYIKGMIFSTVARKEKNEIMGKTWYHTFQASADFFPFFYSLGVRSEVLTIFPLDSESVAGGIALPPTVNREEALEIGTRAAFGNVKLSTMPGLPSLELDPETGEVPWAGRDDSQNVLFEKSYLVGDKLFLLYYPIIQVIAEGSVCDWTYFLDGITGSILSNVKGDAGYSGDMGSSGVMPSPPALLTHRCRNCGNDLKPGDFDIAYYCDSCFRLWLLEGDDYSSEQVRVLEPVRRTHNTVFVPFWEFVLEVRASGTNRELATVGDLSTIMKMGRHMLRNEDPSRPLTFFVPALVTRNAGTVMKLAVRINTFQKDLPVSPSTEFPHEKILHASLRAEEAEEMLAPLLFAVIGKSDRSTLDFLTAAEISTVERRLLWYPFENKGDMLVDQYHQYHFPKRSMDVSVF